MGKLSECGAGFTVNDHVLHTKAKFKLSDDIKVRAGGGARGETGTVGLAPERAPRHPDGMPGARSRVRLRAGQG